MSLTFDALLLDLSGVLYDDNKVIDGAIDCVREARHLGLQLRFVTNTATRSHHRILQQLLGMGFSIESRELYTAPRAAATYLEQHNLSPLALVHPAIASEFSHLTKTQPNCVVLGDARDGLTYEALNQAFRLCHQGLPLIGIGLNRYFNGSNGLMLDAGGFITGLAWAAQVEPIIMGKPSAKFYQHIVASTGLNAKQCLMVGDDVAADVVGAVAAGLQACLVQTGKFRANDLHQLPQEARTIASINDLFKAYAR